MTSTDPRDVIVRSLGSALLPCITSSFQAECVVLTHMLREVRPDIPVLFLDTFHHFPQTLAYRDEIIERWGLRLINLRAVSSAHPALSKAALDALAAQRWVPARVRSTPIEVDALIELQYVWEEDQ